MDGNQDGLGVRRYSLKDRTDELVDRHSFFIGIFLLGFFGIVVAWGLTQYAIIVTSDIDAEFYKIQLIADHTPDSLPRAFAEPDTEKNLYPFGSDTNWFTSEDMHITFAYPGDYSISESQSGEGMLMFIKDSGEDVIGIVQHTIPRTVSIHEFVLNHEAQRLEGCIDFIDCIDSERSEVAIVAHFPTVIRIPKEYLAYIRADEGVYEILVTSGVNQLELILNSITFLPSE